MCVGEIVGVLQVITRANLGGYAHVRHTICVRKGKEEPGAAPSPIHPPAPSGTLPPGLTMLRRQMTRDGLPTNTDPAARGRLASSSPPAEEEDGEGEPEDREEDADRDSSGRLGAVGSALMMTPERRSVFWAIRGVCMP